MASLKGKNVSSRSDERWTELEPEQNRGEGCLAMGWMGLLTSYSSDLSIYPSSGNTILVWVLQVQMQDIPLKRGRRVLRMEFQGDTGA